MKLPEINEIWVNKLLNFRKVEIISVNTIDEKTIVMIDNYGFKGYTNLNDFKNYYYFDEKLTKENIIKKIIK